jgi:hypothetical protein
MQKYVVLVCLLLMPTSRVISQVQPSKDAVSVEVVATASEYVPRSSTVSSPGHSYTNCLGSTDYFGEFRSRGYGNSGSISGTADTRTSCKTTFSPPTESTLTTYLKVNYTIAKSEHSLYLLGCTQKWKPTGAQMAAGVIGAIAAAGAGNQPAERSDQTAGKWSKCPAFAIGGKYTLSVRNTSDARLEDMGGGKPSKLDYLSSVALPAAEPKTEAPTQAAGMAAKISAMVHVTSSPSGGEIYIDGKFYGNTPSDITLTAGEHAVMVTAGGKEWRRVVQVTPGAISVHAEIPNGGGIR